ncbi:hypothetical protein ACC691_40890, partial [Rhizobium johnstonii]|uniref:hypothetical protein n=1 Tax=Rhizobium johnstonii TaxID=3019933 RepID=UPI003F9E19E0
VLCITGEYSSGMIRATFTAVPRRFSVILAKVLILSIVIFAASTIALALSAVVTSALFIGSGHPIHFVDASVILPILGAAV